MTCIAAIVESGRIWMAADSAGVAGLSLQVRRDPKIYRVGEFLFGFTSSFRMGQILGYGFEPPPWDGTKGIERYMNTLFIDALRASLKAGGYAKVSNNEESGGTFLVGYRGRLFRVESDFQVCENQAPYDAIGCGADVALGALYALQSDPPQKRLTCAMEAAEAFSAGVRRPFYIEVSEA